MERERQAGAGMGGKLKVYGWSRERLGDGKEEDGKMRQRGEKASEGSNEREGKEETN